MAREIGDVIVLDVDGKETPAMVLAVDDAGALTLRVFGSTSEQDRELRHVDETGEPFDYEAAERAAAEPAPAESTSSSSSTDPASSSDPRPPAEQATPAPAPSPYPHTAQ